MGTLEELPLLCPYCNERITLLVDCSVAEQSYVEDCEVCCQPIVVELSVSEQGAVDIRARVEND